MVWNSRGANWGSFWRNHYSRQARGGDTVGILLESGWAPWVRPVDVAKGRLYPYPANNRKYIPDIELREDFCRGVFAANHTAYWVPWVRTMGAVATNTRCSLGAVVAPGKRSVKSVRSPNITGLSRTLMQIELGPPGGTDLVVIGVHARSGGDRGTVAEFKKFITALRSVVPTGAAGFIVGDMNIDLKTVTPQLPGADWTVVRTNADTYSNGTGTSTAELDWGLLWDPNNIFRVRRTARVLMPPHSLPKNNSDHAVIEYELA